MEDSNKVEIGFLIELVISGEANKTQFEQVMSRVESEPEVASLFRQACGERELMGGEVAKEALTQVQTQAEEKTREQIERDRSKDLDQEL